MANAGKVAYKASYDGSELSRGLRRSKGELEEFAKNAKRAFQFGAGEAGVHILKGAMQVATAGLRAMRGDAEAAWEVIGRLPFGLGAAIQAARDFWKEMSGEAASAEIAAKIKASGDAARGLTALHPGAKAEGAKAEIDKIVAAYQTAAAAAKTKFDAIRKNLAMSGNVFGRDETTRLMVAASQQLTDELASLERVRADAIAAVKKRESDAAEKEAREAGMRELKEIVRMRGEQYDAERAEIRRQEEDLAKFEEELHRQRLDRVKNAARQDELSGGRRAFDLRVGNEGMDEGERAGREAVQEIRDAAERERRARQEAFDEIVADAVRAGRHLDEINRENRERRIRMQQGDLAGDIQRIRDDFAERRRVLDAENGDLNKNAIEALKRGERLAIEERRRQERGQRSRHFLDISGQDLSLGGNNLDTSKYLRPMLGVLQKMNNRAGRQDYAVRPHWGPVFV